MNKSQAPSRSSVRQGPLLTESVEKRGWKENTGGPRPAPPKGQGRTPMSDLSNSSRQSDKNVQPEQRPKDK